MAADFSLELACQIKGALAPAHPIQGALPEQEGLQAFVYPLGQHLAHCFARNGFLAVGDADARLGHLTASIAHQRLGHGKAQRAAVLGADVVAAQLGL